MAGRPPEAYTRVADKGVEAAIWNPNATASWSLLFTPAFGAYLQMLNWQALGEPEKSAASKTWFHVSLGMLALALLLSVMMDDKQADAAVRAIGFAFLMAWYFSSGREQGKYVKEKFGSHYPRRPWGKALLGGVGGIFVYFLVAVVVGFVSGVAS
jgi:hypothetical protein